MMLLLLEFSFVGGKCLKEYILIISPVLAIYSIYEYIKTKNKLFLMLFMYPLVSIAVYLPIIILEESIRKMIIGALIILFPILMIGFDFIARHRTNKKCNRGG